MLNNSLNMTIKAPPFLTCDEFITACHHLDRQYRQARLGPLRRRWRLSVCTALDLQQIGSQFDTGSGFRTYVQITRPLEVRTDAAGLAAELARFSMDEDKADDKDGDDYADDDDDDDDDDDSMDLKMRGAEDDDQVRRFRELVLSASTCRTPLSELGHDNGGAQCVA